MHTGQKLQIPKAGSLGSQFFRNKFINAFQLKWMVIQKPHHIFFVFFFCYGTGTENQYTSWFYIFCCFVQNISLEDHQFLFFLCCGTVFDLRFLTNNAIS